MDLAEFDLEPTGATMEVLHPKTGEPLYLMDGPADETTGEPTAGTKITLTVVGLDSPELKEREQAKIDKILSQTKPKAPKAAEIEEDRIGDLATSVKGWTGIVLDGKTLEFNRRNVITVLKRAPWLRRQLDTFLSDHRNFLKASPTS